MFSSQGGSRPPLTTCESQTNKHMHEKMTEVFLNLDHIFEMYDMNLSICGLLGIIMESDFCAIVTEFKDGGTL